MPAILSVLVFVFAAGLAIAALAQSWAAYGSDALALRDEISVGDEVRELRFAILEVGTRPRGATVLRPDFSRKLACRQPSRALRAAA